RPGAPPSRARRSPSSCLASPAWAPAAGRGLAAPGARPGSWRERSSLSGCGAPAAPRRRRCGDPTCWGQGFTYEHCCRNPQDFEGQGCASGSSATSSAARPGFAPQSAAAAPFAQRTASGTAACRRTRRSRGACGRRGLWQRTPARRGRFCFSRAGTSSTRTTSAFTPEGTRRDR
ncbi:unnamed protein product, partial [Prorocentrum cordatum]